MAEFLPVRALNRSQGVRINKQRVTNTKTTYVDLSNPVAKREFQHHSAIGAVFTVGPITNTSSEFVVQSGASTDQGSSASDMVVTTYAGVIKNRETGATVNVAQTDTTISTADATNPRNDLIQVDETSGAVSKVTGTAAASPAVPSAEAGKLAVAVVNVPANDTAITTNQISDLRPFA
jgi:hypothetical protein